MKKYILMAGYVKSRNDGDLHYISANKLLKLYKLHRKECVVVNSDMDLAGVNIGDYTILRPSYSGNYDLDKTDKHKSLEELNKQMTPMTEEENKSWQNMLMRLAEEQNAEELEEVSLGEVTLYL